MLKRLAVKATLWSATDIISRQGLQLLAVLVLARLVNPADFGLFGAVMLFTGVASVFADGGFSAALIQRQDASHADESTVFWFNCIAGLAMALVLCAISPAIASFYDRPVLIPLVALMALGVLLSAIGAIQTSLLTKQLDFRAQARAGVAAATISGIIAVWMASLGYGVWALAAQSLLMGAINSSLLWWFSSWRPLAIISRDSAMKLWSFGGFHFASTLMDSIYSRLYTVPIGKMEGVRSLGYFVYADNLQQMPGGVLVKVFGRVAFPMFAAANGDVTKLRRGMQLAIRVSMLINVPVMLGLAVVAEPMVQVVFGARWLPSVPILRVLCLGGVFLPLHVLNLNCLMAMGYSRLMFQVELAKKILGLLLLVAGARFGPMGVAWAMTLLSVFGLGLNTHYSKRVIDFGFFAQVLEFLPILAAGGVMAAVVLWTSFHWNASPPLRLAGLVGLGAVVFAAMIALMRPHAAKDAFELLGSASARTARGTNT